MRIAWTAVLAAACGGQPVPVEPIAGKAVAPEVERAPPRASAGHVYIQFAPDTAGVSSAAAAALDSVVQSLRADPATNLQISGHTDSSERDADDTGTTGLSQARADAVRDYLIARGIAERRLVVRAVGAAEPRDTPAANRRVDFERVTIKRSLLGRVVITDADVEILDPVTFEPDKDVITATSFPALDAVAATLQGNPSILLVEVQSHTDERGDAGANMRLTEARARAIVSYLVAKGVDPARLVAQGYGATQPLDARHDEAAWAKNRRVAFLVLKRSP